MTEHHPLLTGQEVLFQMALLFHSCPFMAMGSVQETFSVSLAQFLTTLPASSFVRLLHTINQESPHRVLGPVEVHCEK